MSETTLLESRVDKIERDNRRLKLTLGALLLALAAVPLIGAVMPEQINGSYQLSPSVHRRQAALLEQAIKGRQGIQSQSFEFFNG